MIDILHSTACVIALYKIIEAALSHSFSYQKIFLFAKKVKTKIEVILFSTRKKYWGQFGIFCTSPPDKHGHLWDNKYETKLPYNWNQTKTY